MLPGRSLTVPSLFSSVNLSWLFSIRGIHSVFMDREAACLPVGSCAVIVALTDRVLSSSAEMGSCGRLHPPRPHCLLVSGGCQQPLCSHWERRWNHSHLWHEKESRPWGAHASQWDRKIGELQSMGLQRVRHNWATELNWDSSTEQKKGSISVCSRRLFNNKAEDNKNKSDFLKLLNI